MNEIAIASFATLAMVLSITLDLPQLWKIWRTKSIEDFSLVFLLMRSTMIFSWLMYGILTRDIYLIASNSICIMSSILYLIFYYINKY